MIDFVADAQRKLGILVKLDKVTVLIYRSKLVLLRTTKFNEVKHISLSNDISCDNHCTPSKNEVHNTKKLEGQTRYSHGLYYSVPFAVKRFGDIGASYIFPMFIWVAKQMPRDILINWS